MSANSVDPNLKDDTTDEFIIGVDREVGLGFAVGANYVWRRYANFQWSDRNGLATSDYSTTSFQPAASACPAAQSADCPAVTIYTPNFQIPTVVTLSNVPSADADSPSRASSSNSYE